MLADILGNADSLCSEGWAPLETQSRKEELKRTANASAHMLHNLRHQLSILHHTPKLLRYIALFIIRVPLIHSLRWGKVHINVGAFACENFRIQTASSEVYRGTVDLVQHDRWKRIQHL